MTNPMCDVLLLDFGGVCLLNPVELHHKAESLMGLDAGSLTWMGPMDPDRDQLWQRMVAGDGVTERDYWSIRAAEISEAAGTDLSRTDYMRMLYDPPTAELIRSEATSTVEAARAAGYGISVLTNDLRAFHGPSWEESVDFLRLVDHIVDCSDTNVLKPDRRAFDRAVEIVGVPADRVLFVDDLPLNVEGARAAGLNATWFDIAQAKVAWAEVAQALGLNAGPPRPG